MKERPTIKFSHSYFKLNRIPNGPLGTVTPVKSATLIKAISLMLKDLPDSFIAYDTAYPDGNYPLKQGKYLLLLFLTNEFLFTTLRPYNPQKEIYYRGKEGQVFIVEVGGESKIASSPFYRRKNYKI